MSNFITDLSKAKKYERLIGNRFETKGWHVTYAPDKFFPDYDLKITKDGKTTKIEIKVDYMSCKTGNIAVEYCKANRKTKSGVTAGDMNSYIFYLLPNHNETTFRYFILKKIDLYNIAKANKKFEAICPDKNGFCLILPLTFIKKIKPIKLNMTKVSKNFSLSEFTNSDTAKRLNIDNSLPLDGITDLRIKALATNLLQPLRDKFKRMTINSGYRCEALNKAVGGVPTSEHRLGQAADVVFNEAKHSEVWKYLQDNPDNLKWRQAIWYKSKGFIHLSYNEADNKCQMIIKN